MSATPAVRDLQTYHLARLLHLVPHLHRVYAENCFLVPLFFSSVSAATKRHAQLILLCLNRRFGSDGVPDIYHTIFSFLSFPELAAVPAVSPLETGRDLPSTGNASDNARNNSASGVTTNQCSEAIAGRKRQREDNEQGDKTKDGEYAPATRGLKADTDGGARDGVRNDTSEGPPPLPFSSLAAPAAGARQGSSELSPVFLVRPPVLTTQTTLPQLYVRMTSEYQLNEETMNTYFGRYGQVSCVLLRERQVGDEERSGGVSYIQDFIVTVDSMNNAIQAVCHAYYRELTFIALHEPDYNVYTYQDADRVLHEMGVGIVEDVPKGIDAVKDGRDASPPYESFIPDVVVDGLPYWLTVDQLRACFSEYGTVVNLRISVDERSGSFTGAALLRMSSVEEAMVASEGLNGASLKGHTLVSGVLDARLNIVSLRSGKIIRRADEMLSEEYDLSENGRRWV